MRILSWAFAAVLAVAACGGSTDGDGLGGAGGSSGSSGSGSGGTSGSGSGGTSGSGTGGTGTGGTGAVYDWESCNGPGQCTLWAKNCCGGYCTDVAITEFLPVNVQSVGVVENQYCSDDIACPGCVSMPQPNYVAVCRTNECTAVDIRSDAISACSGDAECRLRWGSSCCESCGPLDGELIAVNQSGMLEKEVCAPVGAECPPCAPPDYPPDAKAQCVYGQCQVVWATEPGN